MPKTELSQSKCHLYKNGHLMDIPRQIKSFSSTYSNLCFNYYLLQFVVQNVRDFKYSYNLVQPLKKLEDNKHVLNYSEQIMPVFIRGSFWGSRDDFRVYILMKFRFTSELLAG